MPPANIRWQRVEIAAPLRGNCEHQVVDFGEIVEWPDSHGRLWDCDICETPFEVGEVMAMHEVYEDDVGQGLGERYWSRRIHAWHYEMGPGFVVRECTFSGSENGIRIPA